MRLLTKNFFMFEKQVSLVLLVVGCRIQTYLFWGTKYNGFLTFVYGFLTNLGKYYDLKL